MVEMTKPPETIDEAMYYVNQIDSNSITSEDEEDIEIAFQKLLNVLNRHE